jgi:hypothetical protein
VKGHRLALLSLAFGLLFLFPARARAYIDPGTGSYIFQVLLGAFLGMLFALKVFWRRMMQFFKRLFNRRATAGRPDA